MSIIYGYFYDTERPNIQQMTTTAEWGYTQLPIMSSEHCGVPTCDQSQSVGKSINRVQNTVG